MKKHLPIALFIMFGLFLFGPLCDIADACPMCRNATETDNRLPRAFMYSIIFMISMPAMIFTGFGVMFYRLTRKEALKEHVDLQLPQQNEVSNPQDDHDVT